MTNEVKNLPGPARGVRILHGALLAGCTTAGIVLSVFRQIAPSPPAAAGPLIGYVLSGAALLLLAIAAIGVRPRFPTRRSDQSADAYWGPAEIRGSAIFLWAGIEGAALLGWLGYLLTGSLADAAAGVVALVVLFVYRPSRIEGDEAA